MNKSHLIAAQVLSKLARDVRTEKEISDDAAFKAQALAWGMSLLTDSIAYQPRRKS